MRDNGKGDKPRPIQDREQFDKNWGNIFKKDKKQPWYKRWFSFKTNCTGNCNQGRSCDCK